MARYYLIPNETDEKKLKSFGVTRCPKYLYEGYLGSARGVTDWNNVTGKEYYIIIIDDDKQDMTELEKQSDVKKIDATYLTKENVSSLGISVVASKPSQDELEKMVVKWLTGSEKTLRTL
ncbi:MAG: hypothetical protein BWY21_02042 [Parcubacteria group bacterium ADurb.Bin216]|jgi:hypothetical protein|nr:MAG: hypothetical protein BWY21_02042 [Parcubacteria group bacterium ADurb.Bin216]